MELTIIAVAAVVAIVAVAAVSPYDGDVLDRVRDAALVRGPFPVL